jgi:uncharacterized protein
MGLDEALQLPDWRSRAFALYQRIRSGDDHARVWSDWRDARDEMFRNHPQSPIAADKRGSFGGAEYFDYDPSYRVLATPKPAEPEDYDVPTSTGETFTFQRLGSATFELNKKELTLELYWLTSYGGGLFVPFRDATSGKSTYGAGRYLLDTIKGADLGIEDGQLVFDFNFAYNPSCSYDSKWACPLAPPANRLDVAIEAGEKHSQ